MSTNTLKQALEIVYGDIKNINKRVKNLESASAGVLYNETTKSAVAYQDNVSANACPYALLNKVGGMSYKENWFNMDKMTRYRNIDPNGSYTEVQELYIYADETYYLIRENETKMTWTFDRAYVESFPNKFYRIGFYDENKTAITRIASQANQVNITINIPNNAKYFRLGVNMPNKTQYSFRLVFGENPNGIIQDSITTNIVSKDSNDTALQTINIPSAIQQLEGYGWGINDTCYNYIDFTTKKFIQKVGTRAYQSGDEEDTSVLTDLTTTYYELETPIETDISQYINDNSIQIEPNGTITFENTYQQAIPYEYLYLEKVGANNE